MSLGFTRFSGSLLLESDLHIGDGDADGNRATFVRDEEGNPTIPGSTLKGALRACFDPETAGKLFGTAKDDGTGNMGRLIFYAARLRSGTADPGDLPAGEPGMARAAHVAIDRARGGAEARKLFEIEMAPAGARFDFEAVALAAPADVEDDIRTALAPLATGLALGRGTGRGNGRLRLDPESVGVVRRRLDISGNTPRIIEDAPQDLAIPTVSRGAPGERLSFFCPGPYLSRNPEESRSPEEDATGGRDNILFSLRRSGATPVLWPESLYGVLRRRCAWIARTDATADGDDRFRVLSDREGPEALTRTERLFGVSGWRGLVRLSDMALSGGLRMSADGQGIAGIAIDRLSGAVLDGKLFFGDAWTGVTLTFTLGLDPSRCLDAGDQALFAALVAEIQLEGLQVGHGTNRGFGWFDLWETPS